MFWANIGPHIIVNHPMTIPELQPGESKPFNFNGKSMVSGMIVFIRPGGIEKKVHFYADNGILVDLYLPDGRKLVDGQLVHAVRARSLEK